MSAIGFVYLLCGGGLSFFFWWYPFIIRPVWRSKTNQTPYPFWSAVLLQLSVFCLVFATIFHDEDWFSFVVAASAPPFFFMMLIIQFFMAWDYFLYLRPALAAGVLAGVALIFAVHFIRPKWTWLSVLPALIVVAASTYPLADRTVQKLMAEMAASMAARCLKTRSLRDSFGDQTWAEPHATLFVGDTPYYWSYHQAGFLPFPPEKHYLAGRCED